MCFNSMAYIFGFLPIVIFVYFFLNKKRLIIPGKIWLILASIFFYSSFNIKYTPLLLIYVVMNFCFYKQIHRLSEEKSKAKAVLITSIVVNLLILAGFKYCNFFIETINFAFKNSIPYINIIIPLAISLQTLQQIGFLVDSYKNKDIDYSFIDYCLFSIFFPQMIIGPIIKYNETIPQFNNLRKKIFNHKIFVMGITIFLVGFYKKSFFAAALDETVIDKLTVLSSLSTVESWLLCIFEYFRIYLELSGIMDMAIGSAMMLNIELPINFKSPMQANSIADFWERWQITFARFMKKYVYLPLKSLNNKDWFIDLSILLTCILGGLWLNSSICAIFWGVLHGFGFLIYRTWNKLNFKLPNFISVTLTFIFVAFAGMFFKVQTISQMRELSSNLFSLIKFDTVTLNQHALTFLGSGAERTWAVFPLVICVIGLLLTMFRVSIEGKDLAKFVKPNFIWTFILALAIVELIYFYTPPARYMYYNF